jgi:hypothetical protein
MSRSLDRSRQEREAWQQAQEGRQRTWEVRQGKHILDAEKKLADQLKEARREWRDWSAQVQQEHQEWRAGVDLEKELARLPHIEQVELAHETAESRLQPRDWHAPTLYKADLRGRDLAHRYMERADLREAQLSEASLYMADLTGASLTGANLQQANLMGANLTGADLRGANLRGSNLMVADLHNAILHGADLTGARNLTPEQLQSAIYDSTTIIDSAIDITLPRIPSVATTPSRLLTASSSAIQANEAKPAIPIELDASADANTAETPAPNEASTPGGEENMVSTDQETVIPESHAALPASAPSPIEEAVASRPEESIDSSVLSDTEVPEDTAPVATSNPKRSASRKRASKARQATSAAPQTANNSQEADALSATPEEEILARKIIQWPARVSWTRSQSGSTEQNKGDKSDTNFNAETGNREDQHAQAN